MLRAVTTEDVAEVTTLLRRNKTHLAPWTPLPATDEDPTTLLSVARAITRQRQQWAEGSHFPFLIVEKGESPDAGAIIGRISLNALVRGAFHNTYLGYWIDVNRQGQGLMTEGIRLALGFAFGAAGLHRVQAAIMPRNQASLRVVEKVGFRREGFAQRYLQIAGKWEDHLLFAITQEEWPPGPP